jgi:hypothetical protein
VLYGGISSAFLVVLTLLITLKTFLFFRFRKSLKIDFLQPY